jgi:hypothetical protein
VARATTKTAKPYRTIQLFPERFDSNTLDGM